jgi:hypothetical protein
VIDTTQAETGGNRSLAAGRWHPVSALSAISTMPSSASTRIPSKLGSMLCPDMAHSVNIRKPTVSPLVEVERKIFDVAGGHPGALKSVCVTDRIAADGCSKRGSWASRPDVRTHRAVPAVRSGAIKQEPLLPNKDLGAVACQTAEWSYNTTDSSSFSRCLQSAQTASGAARRNAARRRRPNKV